MKTIISRAFLILAGVVLLVGVSHARDVSVTNVGISNVNAGAGTCTINYDLSRTTPAISASQPIWIFVKYRLSTDTDYTGWQDTDDHDATNDDSDGRFTGNNGSTNADSDTVNANLTGDVGIVESGGSKQITWTWGSGGTNLSFTNSVRVRVYAVEMVLVPYNGGMEFGKDTSANNYILDDDDDDSDYDPPSKYYLMKYPCSAEMYAAFLNCCVNRHEDDADNNHDFYNSEMTDEDSHDRLDMTGTVSTDAVFTANSGQEDYAMTYVNWYNAYDWCKWAGLSLPTEEMFEYEASNVGGQNFPWPSNDAPNFTDNIRCNMNGVAPSNASDVRSYDGYGGGLSGLSAHGAAEMSGNVFEWQFTKWYSSSYDSNNSTEAQAGYANSSERVLRGGYFQAFASWMRAASRSAGNTENRNSYFGFRAAKLP